MVVKDYIEKYIGRDFRKSPAPPKALRQVPVKADRVSDQRSKIKTQDE